MTEMSRNMNRIEEDAMYQHARGRRANHHVVLSGDSMYPGPYVKKFWYQTLTPLGWAVIICAAYFAIRHFMP